MRSRTLLLALLLVPSLPSAQPRSPAPERVAFAEAMRRAAVASTQRRVSIEEVRRAEALVGEARSAALPLLSGQASYTRLSSRTSPLTGARTDPNQEAASALLQVPLLAPSRWRDWAHASEAVGVARASDADVERATVLGAARAYLAILAQKRVVDVSRSARDIARARFDFAHARRSGGIGNAVEELRAEQQLATSEVQLASGEVGLARAREALGVLTGSDGPLDAVEEPAFEARAIEEAAAESRVDVRAARSRLDAAEHVARDSWTDWLPTLLATGQVFYQNPASVTTPQTGWQVQFVLSVPIYEGGLRVSQQAEREALARAARAALDGTLRQARSDVRLAMEEVSRQEGALGSARVAAERARSVLDLQTQAYRAGAANDLDVTTAQQQSRDADLAAVIAEDGVRQARLDLLAAIGQFP
jgi:outer membrane protein